jgi:uncharacterized membrane protein (DUF2068 family)
MPAPRRHDRVLRAIALFKLTKAVLLLLAGAGALSLLRPSVEQRVREWVADFAIREGHRFFEWLLQMLNVATPGRITLVGLASICYGLLFAVEGMGLWLEKRWAEYLTVVATGTLIPFELYELARRVTPVRAAALVVNVAAVVYLVYQLRRRARRAGAHAADGPALSS